MREYFMKTSRIGFSKWCDSDLDSAELLWGEKDVTRYICASGIFSKDDIAERLDTEIKNGKEYGVQYWPIFDLATNELIGCCGLRPFEDGKNIYEIGCHLRKKYWGKGYASESLKLVINYAFTDLQAEKIFLGHHPQNTKSKKLAEKLHFKYIGDNFYKPTGLYHPSYELTKSQFNVNSDKERFCND